MDKKIKLIIYIIMQTSVLLVLFLMILLSIKFKISIEFSMIVLSITQLFLALFVFNNFFNKKK